MRDPRGSLHPYTLSDQLTGSQLLQLLSPSLSLPPDVYLSSAGRPIRPHIALREYNFAPGTTIDVLARLSGGAPSEPPSKKPRSLHRSEATAALQSFLAGPFVAWRQHIPPAELARDAARLAARWGSSGVDLSTSQANIAEALAVSPDQTLEILWAWEAVYGWAYDPSSDTFSQPTPMDIDSSFSSPLDEVARLRLELERVTQEAATLRAQLSPPLSEATLLQLLASAPPTPWVHALGEALLHAIRAQPPLVSDPPNPASTLANNVWSVLQQFALNPSPSVLPQPQAATAPSVPISSPSQGVCFSCGLPGHWARNCRQSRLAAPAAPHTSFRQGGLSILPGGQTVFTAASGRTFDVASNPPYPCGRCHQSHWFFQPCPSRAHQPQPF